MEDRNFGSWSVVMAIVVASTVGFVKSLTVWALLSIVTDNNGKTSNGAAARDTEEPTVL